MSKYMDFYRSKMGMQPKKMAYGGDVREDDESDEEMGQFAPEDSSGEPEGDDYDDDFEMMAHGGSVPPGTKAGEGYGAEKEDFEGAPHMSAGGMLPMLLALLSKGGQVPGGTEAGEADSDREKKQFQGKPAFPQAARQRMAKGGMMSHQALAQAFSKKRRG